MTCGRQFQEVIDDENERYQLPFGVLLRQNILRFVERKEELSAQM